jgi:hypothetical protein
MRCGGGDVIPRDACKGGVKCLRPGETHSPAWPVAADRPATPEWVMPVASMIETVGGVFLSRGTEDGARVVVGTDDCNDVR